MQIKSFITNHGIETHKLFTPGEVFRWIWERVEREFFPDGATTCIGWKRFARRIQTEAKLFEKTGSFEIVCIQRRGDFLEVVLESTSPKYPKEICKLKMDFYPEEDGVVDPRYYAGFDFLKEEGRETVEQLLLRAVDECLAFMTINPSYHDYPSVRSDAGR